MKRYEQIVQ